MLLPSQATQTEKRKLSYHLSVIVDHMAMIREMEVLDKPHSKEIALMRESLMSWEIELNEQIKRGENK